MDKLTYRQFKVGDRVSVKQSDTAYDNAPAVQPSMVGTIKSFPAKVSKVKGPLYDTGDYFAYIIFDATYTVGERSYPIRAGIDICNLKRAG